MTSRNNTFAGTRFTCVAMAIFACIGHAHATDLELPDGWSGTLTTTLAVGQSWRARSADRLLYSAADGAVRGLTGDRAGLGGSTTDSGNLNYDRGDTFSQVAKFTSDLSLAKADRGGFLRLRGWYDNALINNDVPFGSQGQRPTPYVPGKLSDSGLDRTDRFKAIQVMDAYVYSGFDVGGLPLQLKVGNQVLNWGESLFTLGINQSMPIDLGAANRGAGTEIKEFLLPVPMVYANLGLSGGMSVEGFWQFGSARYAVPGCGQYFGVNENAIAPNVGRCNVGATIAGSNPAAIQNGLYLPQVNGSKPERSGQFGLAMRFPVKALDTEFGLYAQRVVPRTPIISAITGTTTANGSPAQQAILQSAGLAMAVKAFEPLGMTSGEAVWEYPGHMKIFGVSATTTIGGWSTGAELSYKKDVPAQINGNDLLVGLVGGAGPLVADPRYAAAIQGVGNLYHGYDLFNVTQFQVNAVRLFPGVLGAQNLTVAGEFAMQRNNVPDFRDGGLRYGRAFIFGNGAHPLLGGGTCFAGNPQPDGCQNEGYITRFAAGINLLMALTYNQVFGSGVTATGKLYLKRDLKGNSIDGQFVEDRGTVALGLSLDFSKRFALDLSYVTFNHSAKFDPMRDRDFYSVALSTKF
ncbi:DUF1302 domain-containing protein [Methylibium sp.]|uniref:DUF1302 domain-containing protein n=1 Tax=Methylibium sp. TaxID=2067992 RepID=UPI003D0B009D